MSHTPQLNSGGSLPAKKLTRGKTSLGGGVTKSGCRCGNATAVPGKLTCCGQRCACYTESKPCVDCKCRGCRNPHTADGQKVCPVLPSYPLQLTSDENCQLTGPQCLTLGSNDMATASGGTVQVVGVYTTQIHGVSSGSLFLDANTTVTCSDNPEEDDA
ncbi:uncharacterized protein LOC124360184 [Homalodisca vitripennis]|uniref:uncharacterized protein LOC124360184 n=1 Tax=Homalodisca vitripennis TaxID=197043 RepID=UPI001EE9E510|nr:uncharacterized protein LOC124360184 [Homalodisca vitripennis]